MNVMRVKMPKSTDINNPKISQYLSIIFNLTFFNVISETVTFLSYIFNIKR